MSQQNILYILNLFAVIISFSILILVVYKKRNQNIDIDPSKCGKSWERLVGFIIDLIVCYFMLYFITIILKNLKVNISEKTLDILFSPLLWLYFSVFESSKMQATIGKAFEGIIVTDINGNRITFLRASLRFFATIPSYITFCIGHIMIACTKYNQGLHDMLTNTLVLKKNFKENMDSQPRAQDDQSIERLRLS